MKKSKYFTDEEIDKCAEEYGISRKRAREKLTQHLYFLRRKEEAKLKPKKPRLRGTKYATEEQIAEQMAITGLPRERVIVRFKIAAATGKPFEDIKREKGSKYATEEEIRELMEATGKSRELCIRRLRYAKQTGIHVSKVAKRTKRQEKAETQKSRRSKSSPKKEKPITYREVIGYKKDEITGKWVEVYAKGKKLSQSSSPQQVADRVDPLENTK